MENNRKAKISVILDISNPLRQIEVIQKKLDSITIKRIKRSTESGAFSDIEKSAEKAAEKIKTVEQAYNEAKRAMSKALQANRMDIGFTSSAEYKKLAENLKVATDNLNQFKQIQKSLNSAQVLKDTEKYDMKNLEFEYRNTLQKMKAEDKAKAEEQKRLLKEQREIERQNERERKAAIKEEQRLKKEAAKQNTKATKDNTFVNYSTELAKLERQAAQVFRKMNEPINIGKYNELKKELADIATQYGKINRESVEFRKQIGISSSRGFYDLNHSLDYFRAKVRSRLVYSFATTAEDILTSIPTNIFNALSTYQQNRVNFAQVMPDNIANNQEAMNEAMKNFMQIAADYGTAVEDVTEAGRLWARQYKDIAVVQELVRNSTKLSITDNMSLTEVNKGLEATMQQYNIHLKDANEAQLISGKIVDSWAKLADNAVVTASDLSKANERAAGAAYQAGVGFDYLQAMIATMSAATGKAGGEVGRSIRSMLVSMRSGKAQKFFNDLNIATTELGSDGVRRVRSYEKVITDLMLKLKTSPKDTSDVILAMSGGKYQYNNVMALLKNYDQMQKNLATVRNSQGWADEQVALQYETISRQMKALTADMQQLIRILDEAGASNGLVQMVKDMREFIQVLQNIRPENLAMIGDIVEFTIKIKLLSVVLSAFTNNISKIKMTMDIAKGSLVGFSSGVMKANTSLRLFSVTALGMIGNIAGLVAVLYSLYTVFDSLYRQQNKGYFQQQEIDDINAQTKAYEDYIKVYKESNEIIQKQGVTDSEAAEAKNRLAEASDNLRKVIGDEAYARVTGSKNTEQAVQQELNTLEEALRQKLSMSASDIRAAIQNTETQIEEAQNRIRAYEEETKALKENIKQRLAIMGSLKDNFIMRHLFGVTGMEDELEDYQEQIRLAQERIEGMNVSLAKHKENLAKIEKQQSDIKGSSGGTIEDDDTKDKNQFKGTQNYAEQAQRNQYERERNELWYQGRIEAKAYDNTLKEITNTEKLYGDTLQSLLAKNDVYALRVKSLENYQKKLEDFKSKLIQDLDNRMADNPELAMEVGYSVQATDEQKLKNIEVNKELYQQIKSYSSIVNMISAVNDKIEETKGKLLDVNSNLDLSTEEIKNKKLSNIDVALERRLAEINNPTNYEYARQKIDLEIESQKAKLSVYQQSIEGLRNKERQALIHNNTLELESIRNKLETEQALYTETANKIIELEYNKNLTIRQGLSDIANEFIIQGNTLKEIWSNLWQDLAREAIQRLFRVQAASSFLGSLFGIFGGTKSPIAFSSSPDFNPGYITPSLPTFHSGGLVEQGQAGVVPKLQSNEVVSKLKVGEEVNSTEDRRSNEILGAVAMKAINAQTEKPQNINIFAMDSKSFAQFLNENADILMAVLNKQSALGRRG